MGIIALITAFLQAATAFLQDKLVNDNRQAKYDEYNWTLARQKERLALDDEVARLRALGTVDGTIRAQRLLDDYAALTSSFSTAAAPPPSQGGSASTNK